MRSSFKILSFLILLTAFSGGFLLSAYAADTQPARDCSYDAFVDAMARSESGGNPSMSNCTRGNNGVDHCGKYQFSTYLQQRYGLNSTSSEADQDAAYRRYMADNEAALRRMGAMNHLGTTDRFGTPITRAGIVAMSHLGGMGGANRYLNSGGAYNPGDGCGSSSDFCKGLRDSGMGVSQRNAAARAQGLSCSNRHSYCGTYLSDYLAKFAKYGDGGSECGDGQPTASASQKMCSPILQAQIEAMIKAASAQRQDVWASVYRPPVSSAAMMKMPCKSKELQRIANQFAYAPTGYASNILGQISGAAGPVSGLLNNMVRGDIQSFMNTSRDFGGMFKDIGGLVQGGLNSIMTDVLGISDSPFATALCGIMADTLLKYIQCEVPFTMPSLGNLTGSLNKLLPKGCAGDALRSALYASASEQAFRPMNQSIGGVQGGIFSTVQAPRLTPIPNNTQR